VRTILDAARLASQVTESDPNQSIPHSTIPLIIHTINLRPAIITDIENWSEVIRESVETWLQYAHDEGMPFLMWDDNGFEQMLIEYEPVDGEWLAALPAVNERGDLFQVLLLKHFGGIVSIGPNPIDLIFYQSC